MRLELLLLCAIYFVKIASLDLKTVLPYFNIKSLIKNVNNIKKLPNDLSTIYIIHRNCGDIIPHKLLYHLPNQTEYLVVYPFGDITTKCNNYLSLHPILKLDESLFSLKVCQLKVQILALNNDKIIQNITRYLQKLVDPVNGTSEFEIDEYIKLFNNRSNDSYTINPFNKIDMELSDIYLICPSNFIQCIYMISIQDFIVKISPEFSEMDLEVKITRDVEEYNISIDINKRLLRDVNNYKYLQSFSNSTTIWDHGLRGENVIIGYGSTGIDIENDYFRDPENNTIDYGQNKYVSTHRKIVRYYDWRNTADYRKGFGTYLGGIMCGENIYSSSDIIGVAPKCKLSFDDQSRTSVMTIPTSFVTMFLIPNYKIGSKIYFFSHLFEMNTYNTYSQQVDELMNTYSDYLIIGKTDNDGGMEPYRIFAPANSKNMLVFGASFTYKDEISNTYENYLIVTNKSSKGPTLNQLIKPELYAPGWGLGPRAFDLEEPTLETIGYRSTTTAGGYGTACVALIYQYLIEGFYPSGKKTPTNSISPLNSLLKAMAIQSGRKMYGYFNGTDVVTDMKYPDNYQGFGLIVLDEVLLFDDTRKTKRIFLRMAKINKSINYHQYYFKIIDRRHPFKVTLVWTDPIGGSSDINLLVNDLDLRVFNNNKTYYGNNGQTTDIFNTVEMTYLEDNISDEVYVSVHGNNIKIDNQNYSIVVTGHFDFDLVNITEIYAPYNFQFIPIKHEESISKVPNPTTTTDKTATTLMIIVIVLIVVVVIILSIGMILYLRVSKISHSTNRKNSKKNMKTDKNDSNKISNNDKVSSLYEEKNDNE